MTPEETIGQINEQLEGIRVVTNADHDIIVPFFTLHATKYLAGTNLHLEEEGSNIMLDIKAREALPLEDVYLLVVVEGEEQPLKSSRLRRQHGGDAKHFWATVGPVPTDKVYRLQLGLE